MTKVLTPGVRVRVRKFRGGWHWGCPVCLAGRGGYGTASTWDLVMEAVAHHLATEQHDLRRRVRVRY